MQRPIIDFQQANMDWVIGVNKLLGRTDSMSEMAREELGSRIKGMTEEEKALTAKLLPDDILMDELARRYFVAREMIHDMKSAIRAEK